MEIFHCSGYCGEGVLEGAEVEFLGAADNELSFVAALFHIFVNVFFDDIGGLSEECAGEGRVITELQDSIFWLERVLAFLDGDK